MVCAFQVCAPIAGSGCGRCGDGHWAVNVLRSQCIPFNHVWGVGAVIYTEKGGPLLNSYRQKGDEGVQWGPFRPLPQLSNLDLEE